MKSELTGHSKLDVKYNHILDDSSKNGYVACSFLAVSPMVSHEVVSHDVLCCLMHRVSWYLLVSHDCSCRLMLSHRVSWCLLVSHDGSCRLMLSHAQSVMVSLSVS